jgi:hypothetical protein
MAVDPRHEYTTPEEGRWPKPYAVEVGFERRRKRSRPDWHEPGWMMAVACALGSGTFVMVVWLSIQLSLAGQVFP